MSPVRILRLAGLAIAAALIALILHVGEPAKAWWWPPAFVFGARIVGPAVMPWYLSRRWQAERWRCWALLGYLAVSTGLSAWLYFQAFFVSQSSTAAVALVFVPLYQWAALALLCLMLMAVKRLRASR